MDPRNYKTGWRRLCAHFVDGLVLRPLEWISAWVIGADLPAWNKGLWLSFWSISALSYFIVLHGLFGQTVGKFIFKVRLEGITGESITWKQAILRESPIILLSLGFLIYSFFHFEETLEFYSKTLGTKGQVTAPLDQVPVWMTVWVLGLFAWSTLELISMFTNSKRRAIHDFLAGTVAVKLLKPFTPSLSDPTPIDSH